MCLLFYGKNITNFLANPTFQKLKTSCSDSIQPQGGGKSSLIKPQDATEALLKPN